MADDFIRPQGRLIWNDLFGSKTPDFDPVITDPPYHKGGTVTGRWSGRNIIPARLPAQRPETPRLVAPQTDWRPIELVIAKGFYGDRIATLLLSLDRRQRKRGARLAAKKYRLTYPALARLYRKG